MTKVIRANLRNLRTKKLVHEGEYAAEVEVELIDSSRRSESKPESSEGWAPYLSLEDANKLDRVREALRRDDVHEASTLARVYRLTPVAA